METCEERQGNDGSRLSAHKPDMNERHERNLRILKIIEVVPRTVTDLREITNGWLSKITQEGVR